MVKLLSHYPQTAFDITKAFTISQLGKGHAHKLVERGRCSNALIALISIDTLSKLVYGQKVHYLGKNGSALVHGLSPFALEEDSFAKGLCPQLTEFQIDNT